MAQFSSVQVVSGLGFGDGSISATSVMSDWRRTAEEVITSDAILVPVDQDDDGQTLADDGCGDGRPVARTLKDGQDLKRSLNRAKVFGGGATMAASTVIGLREAQGKAFTEIFANAMALMDQHGLDYGAHTDTHAAGGNCGCGAIDKAPLIIQAVVTYAQRIRQTITTLGINDTGLLDVLAAFAAYATHLQSSSSYSGAEVMAAIAADHKVIKQLDGGHQEAFIVLNMVPGYTVDQAKIRAATEGVAQVFGVDVWRMQAIAVGLYADADVRRKAFLSEVVYTLATAAVLTAGDLPVYVVTLAA